MKVVLHELKRLFSFKSILFSLLLAILGTFIFVILTLQNVNSYNNDTLPNAYDPYVYYCFHDYVSKYGSQLDDIKFDERYKELESNIDMNIKINEVFKKYGVKDQEDISYVYNFLNSIYNKYYYPETSRYQGEDGQTYYQYDMENPRNEGEMEDAYVKGEGELKYTIQEAKEIYENAFGYKYKRNKDGKQFTYHGVVSPKYFEDEVVLFYAYNYVWSSFCFTYQKDLFEVKETHYVTDEKTFHYTDNEGKDAYFTYVTVYAPKARIYMKSSVNGSYSFDEKISLWKSAIPKASLELNKDNYETILPSGVFFDYIVFLVYSTVFIMLFASSLIISSSISESKAISALKYSSFTGRKHFIYSFIAAIAVAFILFILALLFMLLYSLYFDTYIFTKSFISSFLNCLFPLLSKDFTFGQFIFISALVSLLCVIITSIISFMLSLPIRRGSVAIAAWLPLSLILVSSYYFTVYYIHTVSYIYSNSSEKTYASFSVLRPNNIEVIAAIGLSSLLTLLLLILYSKVRKRDY